jgi:2-polyprenyl-3-methyl-5-hydroxy-6-metoxy-1,4-benzoquinol methylase
MWEVYGMRPETKSRLKPLGRLRDLLRGVGQRRLLIEQNRFLLYELRRINETIRYQLLEEDLAQVDRVQTQASFDYQWHNLPGGIAMPDDERFMSRAAPSICEMTGLSAGWFSGKRVVDVGSGAGRYTFGLLSLGALVTACDQSSWSLERTTQLCAKFGDRLTTQKIDLLQWGEVGAYDLAFCFGVVHHTGNTFLAIRNVARKVKPGGKLFLMVYGFPETLSDFQEVNSYEALRQELRLLPFEEKQRELMERFGPILGHGWFDAVSPRINDLLTFEEIAELLGRLGFKNIRRTREGRNHHIVADRL